MTRYPLALVIIVLFAAIGSACGGSESTPDSSDGPTASDDVTASGTLEETPWTLELANVSEDGTRSLESALRLFTIAFGPLPGVEAPPEEESFVPSGTIAIMAMYQHWDELTTEQQAVVTNVTTPDPDDIQAEVLPAASALGPIGKPLAAPELPGPVAAAVTGEQLVQATRAAVMQYRPEMAARLGFDLPGKVLIFMRDIPRGFAVMTSTPDYVNGKANWCMIAIYPHALTVYKTPEEVVSAAVHELFHCFEFVGSPATSVEEFVTHPAWWREGGASWAAGNLVGPDPATLFNSGGWLVYGASSLFARNYDAIGFFAHLDETGIDPWSVFPAIFKEFGNEASYLASKADNDRFLESWASSIVRDPDRGRDWDTTWPGITPEKARLIKVPVFKDVPVSVSTTRYGALIYQLEVDAEVLRIAVGGYGRFSDGDVDTTSVANAVFCHKQGGCETCPDGSRLKTPPPLLKGTRPILLALTGGPGGAGGTVSGESLEDFCKKDKETNAVAVHYDRPEYKEDNCEEGEDCTQGPFTAFAGRTMELVSCDGPYGTWKGVMRQGGWYDPPAEIFGVPIAPYSVPFADFPVEFTVGGDGMRNLQSTSTGRIQVDSSVLGAGGSERTYDLDITVDGSEMTVIASLQGLGYTNPFYDQFKDMPIEPASEGSCP